VPIQAYKDILRYVVRFIRIAGPRQRPPVDAPEYGSHELAECRLVPRPSPPDKFFQTLATTLGPASVDPFGLVHQGCLALTDRLIALAT
jgi:hypothetical protein